MESVATSVRIVGDATTILSHLAERLGQSKAVVIELALKQMEERLFWDEVRQSYDRIASDSLEISRIKAEVDLWDQGTARDLQNEEW